MQRTSKSFKALGILWLLFGALSALEAAWLVLNMNTLRLMWGALLDRVPDPYPWMSLFDMLILVAIVLGIITAVFSFLGAVALMQNGPSKRFVAIVAAILALMCGPLGIALGVYTLVTLLPRHAGPVFEHYAVAA